MSDQDFYDPYFYWARPGNRRRYLYQFKNLHVEDVTCSYCIYRPKPTTQYPKQCYRAHMRKQHPAQFALEFKPNFIIREDDPFLALTS